MRGGRRTDATDAFVGQRVRMARMLAKKTQSELGEALGISFQQIQKYEKGVNRIGAGRLREIAAVLGQSVTWFYDEAAKKKGEPADLVQTMAVEKGGLALAQAFLAIPSRALRRALVGLAEIIAAETAGYAVPQRKRWRRVRPARTPQRRS